MNEHCKTSSFFYFSLPVCQDKEVRTVPPIDHQDAQGGEKWSLAIILPSSKQPTQ